MDDIDRANNQAATEVETLLKRRVVYSGNSALKCIECRDLIPAARRHAIPGCRLCVDCQEYLEQC